MLRQKGEDPDRAAHFLIRLLFCLFAEDFGLLPERLFGKLVAATRTRPEAFTAQLRQLFGVMRGGGFFGMEQIPQFDGGLFDDEEVPELDAEGMRVLHRASALDPSKRAQLGAHYTSREDILAVVEPVLMAPLRRRWAEVREQAETLTGRRGATTGGQATRLNNDLSRPLSRFAEEIASVRVLDPACGSGNFLSVSMQQLLNSEKEEPPTKVSEPLANRIRGPTNARNRIRLALGIWQLGPKSPIMVLPRLQQKGRWWTASSNNR